MLPRTKKLQQYTLSVQTISYSKGSLGFKGKLGSRDYHVTHSREPLRQCSCIGLGGKLSSLKLSLNTVSNLSIVSVVTIEPNPQATAQTVSRSISLLMSFMSLSVILSESCFKIRTRLWQQERAMASSDSLNNNENCLLGTNSLLNVTDKC